VRRFRSGRDALRALDVDELRALARRRLPRMVFEYLDGGAEDESTLRRNRAVFDRWGLVPRTLVDVAERDLHAELLGTRVEMPLGIAPTGFNGMLTHRADVALARAARAAGIPFTLSTVSSCSIEEVARDAGGRLWFQLYPVRDQAVVDDLVGRAERAGYEALVLTTDVPVYGNREWDQRNFARPGEPLLSTKLDVLLHPRWLFDVVVPHGVPSFGNLAAHLPPGNTKAVDGARYMSTQLNPTLDWRTVKRLRAAWPRKLLVKGILAVEDARIAVAEGADGLVLSNHGGRQLDGCVSPMEVLAEVRHEVGGGVAVLVDSGFRRGADVAKALALGADAVMVGRAVLYGVAAGGEAGAAHALSILRTELDRVLALVGCRRPQELTPALLRAG
jgi:(S)-mandelate dehydrogenase